MKHAHRLISIVAFAVLLAPFAAAQAATFRASLSGNDQSPVINTPAHGTATFVLSKNGWILHP